MSAEGGGSNDPAEALGLTMPDDLATLLGDNLVVALDGGESGQLELGARITTDMAAANKRPGQAREAVRATGWPRTSR